MHMPRNLSLNIQCYHVCTYARVHANSTPSQVCIGRCWPGHSTKYRLHEPVHHAELMTCIYAMRIILAVANYLYKAARSLKGYNAAAKESGRRPIGLDRNLSFEERQYRSSLRSNFKAARAEGKKAYWSGHRLFINGADVFPVTGSNVAGG